MVRKYLTPRNILILLIVLVFLSTISLFLSLGLCCYYKSQSSNKEARLEDIIVHEGDTSNDSTEIPQKKPTLMSSNIMIVRFVDTRHGNTYYDDEYQFKFQLPDNKIEFWVAFNDPPYINRHRKTEYFAEKEGNVIRYFDNQVMYPNYYEVYDASDLVGGDILTWWKNNIQPTSKDYEDPQFSVGVIEYEDCLKELNPNWKKPPTLLVEATKYHEDGQSTSYKYQYFYYDFGVPFVFQMKYFDKQGQKECWYKLPIATIYPIK